MSTKARDEMIVRLAQRQTEGFVKAIEAAQELIRQPRERFEASDPSLYRANLIHEAAMLAIYGDSLVPQLDQDDAWAAQYGAELGIDHELGRLTNAAH